MQINGVGEKIADCVLAFSLDKPEAFPVDRWTRRALEKWYGLPPRLNNAAAGEWARSHFVIRCDSAAVHVPPRATGSRAASWGGAPHSPRPAGRRLAIKKVACRRQHSPVDKRQFFLFRLDPAVHARTEDLVQHDADFRSLRNSRSQQVDTGNLRPDMAKGTQVLIEPRLLVGGTSQRPLRLEERQREFTQH